MYKDMQSRVMDYGVKELNLKPEAIRKLRVQHGAYERLVQKTIRAGY